MKKIVLITVLFCAVLLAGCARDKEEAPSAGKQARLRLNGSLNPDIITSRGDGEGKIDPMNPTGGGPGIPDKGLPPKQLEIGIITIEYFPSDPDNPNIPNSNEWGDNVPYLDRGFFGGDKPGDSPQSPGITWNGNIEYTNREGTALQHVFYPLTGVYFYFVAVHPYVAIEAPENINGMNNNGEIEVLFNLDGSHDVMTTGVGYGNIDHPWSITGDGTVIDEDVLVFSHKLACLNCRFIAENADAVASYGDIVKVEVVGQPSQVMLNAGKLALDDTEPLAIAPTSTPTAYDAYRGGTTGNMLLPYSAGTYDPNDASGFGYFLVMPTQTYTFRITTSAGNRPNNPLYVQYNFSTDTNPATIVEAGTIYYLTFKMLETDEIDIQVETSTEWWLDQEFD